MKRIMIMLLTAFGIVVGINAILTTIMFIDTVR